MTDHFLFLGTGASMGVPIIGCTCSVCLSKEVKNKRLRSSGLFQVGDKKILLDAGPDVRIQCLREKIEKIDGVLLSHAHFDHIGGVDELRIFSHLQGVQVPALMSAETFVEMKRRCGYFFEGEGLENRVMKIQILPRDFGEVEFAGLNWNYLSYFQGGMKVTGFRLGSFAYVSDIRDYTPQVFESLRDVKTLVISAMRHAVTPLHFSLEEAVAFSRDCNAKMTYLTHLTHDIDPREVERKLPSDIRIAYDGLEVPLS